MPTCCLKRRPIILDCFHTQKLQLAVEGKTACHTKALPHSKDTLHSKVFLESSGQSGCGGGCLSNCILFCDFGL
ncbi:hypothetical protein I79_009470 [Cricetulus griseus]|uniref:Uncharacterized protein n=1 Tax=Cricetulus griseus TaxID=10029 RepID=G3HFV3_CRIGR|nr:hypothetical protein I79_009470 [Cricetulus griseus]